MMTTGIKIIYKKEKSSDLQNNVYQYNGIILLNDYEKCILNTSQDFNDNNDYTDAKVLNDRIITLPQDFSNLKKYILYEVPTAISSIIKEFYDNNSDNLNNIISDIIRILIKLYYPSYLIVKDGKIKYKINRAKKEIIPPNSKIDYNACSLYLRNLVIYLLKETTTNLINNNEKSLKIVNKITKKIIGQDEAVKSLLEAINTNVLTNKNGIILSGYSGSGKTAIIKCIAEELNRPVVIIDSSNIKEDNILEIKLKNAIKSRKYTQTELENTIICIENVTSLTNKMLSDELSSNILNLLNKKRVLLSADGILININTSNFTYIFTGFFEKIKTNNKISRTKDYSQNLLFDTELKFLVPYIKDIIILKKYSKVDLKNILINSEISSLKGLLEYSNLLGISITYDESLIDEIIEKAELYDNGVHSLNKIIQELKNKYRNQLIKTKLKNIHIDEL